MLILPHLISIFIFVKISLQDDKTPLPCHLYQSEDISDAIDFQNGSYSKNGHVYNFGSYGYLNHTLTINQTEVQMIHQLRGCFCGLPTSKPCLPFCCPIKQLRHFSNDSECITHEHLHTVSSKNSETDDINVEENFQMIQGVECESTTLDESDEWSLGVCFKK